MAYLVAKTIKGHKYYYSVEKARINGKSRVVRQIYLGTLENIEQNQLEKKQSAGIPDAEYTIHFEFAAVTALLDLADRLEIRQIIDEEVGKRQQGLPVGDSIVLAAINRAVGQVSKNAFHENWFKKTVLPNCFPLANKNSLSSQGFWNNMSLIDRDMISRIEDEISKKIIKKYNITSNLLLFDNTNFISYINTDSPALLPQRGKSKEHRSDLRIVGLSLMVSPDNNIPLFHEPYPGNTNDAKRFSEIIDKLKSRCGSIQKNNDITLVFDRGNNSSANVEKLIEDDPLAFHYVGGLKQNQCPELLSIPKSEYKPLEGDTFGGTTAFRTMKTEFGRLVTVVLTNNPELFEAQLRGVTNNILKCSNALSELAGKLEERKEGKIFRGRQYSVESVNTNVKNILSAEHMKRVFEYDVESVEGNVTLSYRFNHEGFDNLKEHILGKSILFTDRDNWSNEQIVSAYRAQYHVEECFKQMKHKSYLSFIPIRHYTDRHIIVHAFYCVLALILTSLLNLEFKRMGYNITINKMIEDLSEIDYTHIYYNQKGKMIVKNAFYPAEGVYKEYLEKYNLYKYIKK
ncbi:MAG: IS1634 family transposase [Deltaproteobacteria bacterium]|jgi:transposase|nr:IS1634 family transposase [Deltaproteobacteria bacterium]